MEGLPFLHNVLPDPRPCLMEENETLRSHPDSLILDVELYSCYPVFLQKHPFLFGMKNSEAGNG